MAQSGRSQGLAWGDGRPMRAGGGRGGWDHGARPWYGACTAGIWATMRRRPSPQPGQRQGALGVYHPAVHAQRGVEVHEMGSCTLRPYACAQARRDGGEEPARRRIELADTSASGRENWARGSRDSIVCIGIRGVPGKPGIRFCARAATPASSGAVARASESVAAHAVLPPLPSVTRSGRRTRGAL